MTKIRVPPQSINAEQTVLACQLLGGGKTDVVRGIISPEDFYLDVHSTIQRAILAVADATGGDVDVILVSENLVANGKFEDIGGGAYLGEILDKTYYANHASHYAEIVADCSRRRKAIAIGEALVEKSHDMNLEVAEIAEAANDAAMQMSSTLKTAWTRPRTLREHVVEMFDEARKGEEPTVHWGIPEIDRLIGGVALGEMVVIGARPSQGKSLLGMQWLDCAAGKGIPGLMVSEEMTPKSLAVRALCGITCIPSDQWLTDCGRIEFDIKEHFDQRAPVLIAEKCQNVSAVERAIARAVQSHGVRIVCVDYVQLVDGNGSNKVEQIADVSSRLKAAAMKHGIIMIALAQLNREVEKRDNHKPQLSDFKGSGGIEQDADVALFPYWPFKSDDSEPPDKYLVYVRKNRNRGIGDEAVELRINTSRQRVEPAVFNSDIPESDDW